MADVRVPQRPYFGVRSIFVSVLVGVAGCSEPVVDEVREACQPICDELVEACGLAAFPDEDSCMGGCAYVASQDEADLDLYAICVRQAECDPFDIVECEHAYGID
mgnify:CR=1 FL=1